MTPKKWESVMVQWSNRSPETYTEFMLMMIWSELARISASLSPSKEKEAEVTAVSEEIDLPEDIPGRDKLIEAGIVTLAKVPKKAADLAKLKGIGKQTANQIATYLKVSL